MKHKGGYIKGSIYARKRKDRADAYTAEIQFQGRKLRRTSADYHALSAWVDNVCERVNAHLDAYNAKLSIREAQLRQELYDELMANVGPILAEAAQYDLSNKSCAEANGLVRTREPQTYLVMDEATGYTKIGKSKDIHTRLRIIKTHVPMCQLLGYIPADVERELHAIYSAKRVKGEWFNLSGEDIREIEFTYELVKVAGIFI